MQKRQIIQSAATQHATTNIHNINGREGGGIAHYPWLFSHDLHLPKKALTKMTILKMMNEKKGWYAAKREGRREHNREKNRPSISCLREEYEIQLYRVFFTSNIKHFYGALSKGQ
jgi:hypothetical protein